MFNNSLNEGEVQCIGKYSVMRNYKCVLLNDEQIDMRALQDHCEKHFHSLLNTRISDIVDFLTNPVFDESVIGDNSPLYEGWNVVLYNNVIHKLSSERTPYPSQRCIHG